ncbi:MAG: fructose 1,6-bisphosphatase [Candidatus Altiarchaeota archaeon]
MTCLTLAILDKVDDMLRKRLDDAKNLKDHLIDKAGADYLLATTERRIEFEGVKPVQIDFQERQEEEFVALIAEKPVDFGISAYRIYADPFNTPSLVDDERIGDGFIVKAGRLYDMPEDSLRLLRAIRKGAKTEAVFRRDGEESASMDDAAFLARCGPYHPTRQEILAPFQAKGGKTVKLHVLSIGVKNGKITIDNTFKPKTLKLKA